MNFGMPKSLQSSKILARLHIQNYYQRMNNDKAKHVRQSELAFKQAGGIIRVYRLTQADDECLKNIVKQSALPSMTAAVRYALKRTSQTIGSNAYRAIKQSALASTMLAEAYKPTDRQIRIFRLTLSDQRMCKLIEEDTDFKNATSVIRFAIYAASALGAKTDFGMPKLQSQRGEKMKTIAIANQKGGVGKTTVSTTLSDTLSQRGYSVLLVDADDQASTQVWKENRVVNNPNLPAPDVIGLARPTIAEEIPRIGAHYDFVVIDVGGGSEKGSIALNAACIRAADLVLMPTQPTYYDVHGSIRTIDMIKERQSLTGGLPIAKALIVSQRPNTKLNTETQQALEGLEMPIMGTTFKMREDHRLLPIKGLTGIHGKRAIKAEANELADEVLDLLDMPHQKQ